MVFCLNNINLQVRKFFNYQNQELVHVVVMWKWNKNVLNISSTMKASSVYLSNINKQMHNIFLPYNFLTFVFKLKNLFKKKNFQKPNVFFVLFKHYRKLSSLKKGLLLLYFYLRETQVVIWFSWSNNLCIY